MTPSVGAVNVFELSLDSETDLNNLQADSFTLATLTFDALAIGSSTLSLVVNSFGDALGDPLDVTIQNGTINVVGATVAEPTTLGLLVIGVMGSMLIGARQHRRARSQRPDWV